MSEYKCKICGYIYDEEKGEKRRNVDAGTLWVDVPEAFTCPSCGAPKKSFNEV
ncbi:MAG: rubredoxin [Methanobrevibacter sp.]|nr:rubredoxin [Candidatus Methanoflexus mossambicus]